MKGTYIPQRFPSFDVLSSVVDEDSVSGGSGGEAMESEGGRCVVGGEGCYVCGLQVVVDVTGKADVVDLTGTVGGGEAEDGLPLAHAGTVASEVVVEPAVSHVPGYQRLAFVANGDGGLLDGGHL